MSINQSINQDISNAPANRKSRWRARQSMDEIKQNKIKKIMKVGKDSKTKFKKQKTNFKLEKKGKFSICSWNRPMESSGSRRSSGSEFQNAGEAWKKPRAC